MLFLSPNLASSLHPTHQLTSQQRGQSSIKVSMNSPVFSLHTKKSEASQAGWSLWKGKGDGMGLPPIPRGPFHAVQGVGEGRPLHTRAVF